MITYINLNCIYFRVLLKSPLIYYELDAKIIDILQIFYKTIDFVSIYISSSKITEIWNFLI
jgi:hypothetical protein